MEAIRRIVARVMLRALDDAAKLVHREDGEMQAFLMDLRNQIKPDLDWIARYGEIPPDEGPEDDELFDDLK